MALKYPDILEHNNPNLPLVDITSLKGVAYPLGALINTGSIPSAKRNPGTIVFITSSGEFFGYIGDDAANWDTPTNWEPLGSGTGGSGIFEQTGSFFATTNNLQITGSLTTTGSVNLALETSSTAIDNVMLYDSQSGQVFITSSAAIGGSSITYTGEEAGSPGTIKSISTLDVDPNEATVQWNPSSGNLKFIFGDPPDPSVAISELVTGIFKFETDRFNLQEQTFKIKGTYNKELNTFKTASLSEVEPTPQLLEETTTAVPSPNNFLSREFIDVTGSKNNASLNKRVWKFKMDMETLSIIDGSVVNAPTATMNLELNKTLPVAPSINFNVDEISNFGGQSQYYSNLNNSIEVGATGSISYTSSINADNNWRFIEMENSSGATITPVTISPLGPGNSAISGSIDIDDPSFTVDEIFRFQSSANYDSDNGPGATPSSQGDPLNDPKMETTRPSSIKIINRIKSVRAAGVFPADTQSVINNIDDPEFWTQNTFVSHTYNGAPFGTPSFTGTSQYFYPSSGGNPTLIPNSTVEIFNPDGVVHMIVFDVGSNNTYANNIKIKDPLGNEIQNTLITGTNKGYKYYITGIQGPLPSFNSTGGGTSLGDGQFYEFSF
tara:strand:+ start:1479 stop:3305 length:1827 start_codon:yes stop_codon:yes gene_type:complete